MKIAKVIQTSSIQYVLSYTSRFPDLADWCGTLLDGERAVGDRGAVAGGIIRVQHVGYVVVEAPAARACKQPLHCKKRLTIFPVPSRDVTYQIIKFFPSRESLVSDFPAGDGKISNLFNCVYYWRRSRRDLARRLSSTDICADDKNILTVSLKNTRKCRRRVIHDPFLPPLKNRTIANLHPPASFSSFKPSVTPPPPPPHTHPRREKKQKKKK